MLDALRRGAQGWLAKILFAILIVSFGIFWNVSDVFRGAGRGSVAHVGKEEISVTDFQRAFQNQIQSVQLEGGGRLSTEQALMLRFDRQTLDQLIAQAAVKSHADLLGLSLSDETLAEGVRKDPDFAGPDGKFSRMGFDGLLRQMNVSEHGFLAMRREDEVRRQISDALASSVAVPKTMVDDLNAWRDETRTVEFVQIDAMKAVVADPDEAKITETYEANKADFMTPEYRKVAMLVLSAESLKSAVTLTDDELKTYYEENKATYDTPERRRLQQIAFKDKATAEAARAAIEAGKKNFLEVAKDNGATENDVNLGLVAKADLIDPKIADAAFAVARDKLSPVVEGRFATVLVRAIEIQEGKISTFDEVREKVRDKLAGQRAEGLLQERFDLIEEGRNAGKTLKQVAEEQKIKFYDIEAVDAKNLTPDGKTAIDIPDAAIALKQVFATGVGTQPEAVELPKSAFAWFDVLGVTERKQKPLADIKDEVKAVYLDKEKTRLLNDLASKLAERLRSGETFEAVAKDAGGKSEVSDPIKRQMSPPGLTTEAVKQAFALPKGGAGYADTSDRASRIVFQVKDVIAAPEATKEHAATLHKELSDQLANEELIAYVTAIRKKLTVTINEAELARATGASVESETGQ
ncbi:SurA N-terminal domain-containing protein [Hyphomicrobium sp.]|uniref:SurA N-terminal domain-containing protein n=1 Tax=Hyphomicrobium sp. TaxID=82 RepID=UPI003F714BFB